MSIEKPKIGLFPYGGSGNPYTRLISEAITHCGARPVPLFDTKFIPIRRACRSGVDLLQIYWPGNLYRSSTRAGEWIKQRMFYDGLRCMKSLPCLYSVENLVPHDGKADDDFRVTQQIIDQCSGFITMSKSAADVFCQHYRIPSHTKIFQVPHRNYIGFYPDGISRSEARARLGIPEQARVLLSLGRIQPYKGLHQLIPAFLRASSSVDILLVAGSAKSQDIINQLQKLVVENTTTSSGEVRIVNQFIEDADLQLYHRSADIAVFTYADMPMNPGSLIMSMGFGLPVIAPIKGAIAETAGPDALIGYVDANIESMQNSIKQALAMPREELRDRGARARSLVESRNSLESAAAAFGTIYKHFSLI